MNANRVAKRLDRLFRPTRPIQQAGQVAVRFNILRIDPDGPAK